MIHRDAAATPSSMLCAGIALMLMALPATAQQGPTDVEQTRVEVEAAPGPPEAPEKKKKRDVLFAPVPISSPTTGTGIAVGGVAFYNPNDEPRDWVSGAGVVYTDRGTKGIAGFHSMSFGHDRVRLTAILSYIEARNRFYGIGAEAGDAADRLELRNKQFVVQAQALMRVFDNSFLGLRYHLATNDAQIQPGEEGTPPVATPPPPDEQLDSTLSIIGPVFNYDSRDSGTQPRSGAYVSATWLFGIKALGNTFTHDKLQLAGNLYFPFGAKTVFATRASLCSATGNVPYYDLCMFGSGPDLRGYEGGRYRDRASWAVQGELRQHIVGRFGAVAFFGLGGIAPSAGDILDRSNLLPSAGVGVRYRPFRDNDVHLRIDAAIGKNDHGIYLGIGEAF